jgi:DNA-binding MarR family transcriptional regulator
MTDPTWQDRELRILQLVVEADGRGEHLEVADIADVLSLDEDTAVRVVDSLQEAGYLTGVTVDQPPYLLRIQPTTEARRFRRLDRRGDEVRRRHRRVRTGIRRAQSAKVPVLRVERPANA